VATADEKLALATKHLEKVRAAWDPPDWADLSLYGFYCLEAAVDAATIHLGQSAEPRHPKRVELAEMLHAKHALPDISELLADLNETRKSEVYGDVVAPTLDAEDVAREIEEYFEAVRTFVGK
jgi:hypothetical protein